MNLRSVLLLARERSLDRTGQSLIVNHWLTTLVLTFSGDCESPLATLEEIGIWDDDVRKRISHR